MKNKKSKVNKRNQTKYRLRRLGLVVFLAVIFVILILSIRNKNNIRRVATDESHMLIGNEPLDISKITSTREVNPPTLGARNDTNKVEWKQLGNNYSRRSRMV